MRWQLQEAKQRFSEVVRRASDEGPQTVTRHGRDVVVVVAAEDYERMARKPRDFKDFLLNEFDVSGLDLERDKGLPRDIDLGDR